MGGIPINRFWPQEKHFFSEKGLPVFQGIPFPLKKKSFESGKVRLVEDAEAPGASCRGMDVWNLS